MLAVTELVSAQEQTMKPTNNQPTNQNNNNNKSLYHASQQPRERLKIITVIIVRVIFRTHSTKPTSLNPAAHNVGTLVPSFPCSCTCVIITQSLRKHVTCTNLLCKQTLPLHSWWQKRQPQQYRNTQNAPNYSIIIIISECEVK